MRAIWTCATFQAAINRLWPQSAPHWAKNSPPLEDIACVHQIYKILMGSLYQFQCLVPIHTWPLARTMNWQGALSFKSLTSMLRSLDSHRNSWKEKALIMRGQWLIWYEFSLLFFYSMHVPRIHWQFFAIGKQKIMWNWDWSTFHVSVPIWVDWISSLHVHICI